MKFHSLALSILSVILLTACGQSGSVNFTNEIAELTFDGAHGETEEDKAQHGKRLADVLGCTGCHNPDFSGGPFNEGWIAPNLSLMTTEYDQDTLERAVRQGIALDGRKLRMMPSEMYRALSDADMQSLSTHLLSLEPSGDPQPLFEPFPSDLAQWEIDGYTDGHALGLEWAASPGPIELGPEHARGRYLALNLCTECHNNQLQGYPNFTPDLSVVALYTDEELRRLLFEGKGNVRERLGLMSLVSPARNPYLTDSEYSDLVSYLRARSESLLDD